MEAAPNVLRDFILSISFACHAPRSVNAPANTIIAKVASPFNTKIQSTTYNPILSKNLEGVISVIPTYKIVSDVEISHTALNVMEDITW
jgi:hypothetical protein